MDLHLGPRRVLKQVPAAGLMAYTGASKYPAQWTTLTLSMRRLRLLTRTYFTFITATWPLVVDSSVRERLQAGRYPTVDCCQRK
jgi:hypothetical protein